MTKPPRFVIVDYGLGNLRSVQKACERINIETVISRNREDIGNAEKLILPGVGNFSQGMKNLEKYEMRDILNQRVLLDKIPILGICLGMQLFTDFSEEGGGPGLGWIRARTERFSFVDRERPLKIPHVGWNTVRTSRTSALWEGIEAEDFFYFVHSYHVKCDFPEDALGFTEYGYEFHSAIHRENIYGVQFHPEKSFKPGWRMLKNFFAL